LHAKIADHASFAKGDACSTAVRPEEINVTPLESVQDTDASNVTHGVISTLSFIVDRYEARIQVAWGHEISVHLAPADDWRAGQPVAITIAPHALQVWPADVGIADTSAEDAMAPLVRGHAGHGLACAEIG
jgi:hypothetical protein